ncbi:unnamed protein product [Urochloa decumbens]|uniref:F-box protein n=1 Tax=Urochloa decumbens TaxID=240449 RepID=A0ABC8XHQ9_9POAL
MTRGKKKRNEEVSSMSNRRCRRRTEKPRHLYLVLDDWSWGYSIRKIDLSDDPRLQLIAEGLAPGRNICTSRYRLPPPFFRFQAQRSEPKYIAGAFESKILAMQSLIGPKFWEGVHVYDVRNQSFMFAGQRWPVMLKPIYIPVGDWLFVLTAGSFIRLKQPSFNKCGLPYELPKPTFQTDHVISYAIHPNERTIFVSIGGSVDSATFCFDMAQDEWAQHGQWQLPFIGRGYFDPELDAWVGLSSVVGTFGHLCSCDLAPCPYEVPFHMGATHKCPDLKISKEKLFSEVAAERHIGVTLVYMGGGSRFCLLECIRLQADLADEPTVGLVDEVNEDSVNVVNEDSVSVVNEDSSISVVNPHSVTLVNEKYGMHFLKLTTFSLKYDKIGNLTTGNSRCVRYYSLPQKVTKPMLEHPVAFWM